MRYLRFLPVLALVLAACSEVPIPSEPGTMPPPSASVAAASYNCSAQTDIPEEECAALVALYNATGGPNWTNETASPRIGPWFVASPCDWYGVVCFAKVVTQLGLNENNLDGSIPAEIGDLRNLHYLGLADNQLSGSIPATFGNLSNLVYTHLYSNQLTGPIPPELGNLSSLEGIQAIWNQLSGAIPAELGKLSKLKRLNLAYNQLSGAIPVEFGNLTNLEELGIQSNQLTGVIPAELGNLANLEILALYSNQLTGVIPTVLGNLTDLRGLFLHRNQLSGPIPPELGNLTSLVHLELHENQLSGAIPASLGNLSLLEGLWLADNYLSGLVPIEVARLGGSEPLSLHCAFVSGNDGLYMPATQPYLDADEDNDGSICYLALSSFVPVAIDIKPGSDPNSINLGARGRIPVAILGTDDFDAAAVDPSSVTLGDNYGDDTRVATRTDGSLMASLEDIDGDGDLDLLIHFEAQALVANGDVDENTTLLILNGGTADGLPIRGSDTVRIVRRGRG